MTEDQAAVELSRRKVLGSMAVIGAAGAGAGAGTWAFWSDEVDVDGNTISTAQLSLNEEASQSFEIEGAHPGDWSDEASITVEEDSDAIENDNVELDIDINVTNGSSLGDEIHADLSYSNDIDNGAEPLNEKGPYTGLSRPGTSGADLEFEFTWPADGETSDGLMDTSVEFTVTFLLRQSGADSLNGGE